MRRISATIAVISLSIWASHSAITCAEEQNSAANVSDSQIHLLLSVIDTTIDKTTAVSLLDLSQQWITATGLSNSASDQGRRLLASFPKTLRQHSNAEKAKGEEAKAIIYSAFADYVSASMPQVDGGPQQPSPQPSQAKVEPPPQPLQAKVEPLPTPPLPPTQQPASQEHRKAPKRATEQTVSAAPANSIETSDSQQRWSGYDTQDEEIYARLLRKLKTRHPEMQQQ